MEEPQYPVIYKEHPSKFEIDIEGEKAYIDYSYKHGNLVLIHTFVPENLRGKGLAPQLAKFALDYARDNNKKVVVICPFVATYLKKHTEYSNLIVQE